MRKRCRGCTSGGRDVPGHFATTMINVYFVIVTRIRAAALGASVMHLMRLFPIRNRIRYYLRLGSLARGFPAGRPIAGPGSLQGPSAVDPTWASARNLAPGAIGPAQPPENTLSYRGATGEHRKTACTTAGPPASTGKQLEPPRGHRQPPENSFNHRWATGQQRKAA